MKLINRKIRFSILIITLFISIACIFTSTKRTPTVIPPSAEITFTPIILPTLLPNVVSTTLVTDTPTALPANQIIPDESKALYQELSSGLSQFEVKISQQPKITTQKAVIGVELAFANGNAGEALLNPQVIGYNKALLDRLEAMGV